METIRKILFWGAAAIFIVAIGFGIYLMVNGFLAIGLALGACAFTMPRIMADNAEVVFQ